MKKSKLDRWLDGHPKRSMVRDRLAAAIWEASSKKATPLCDLVRDVEDKTGSNSSSVRRVIEAMVRGGLLVQLSAEPTTIRRR